MNVKFLEIKKLPKIILTKKKQTKTSPKRLLKKKFKKITLI